MYTGEIEHAAVAVQAQLMYVVNKHDLVLSNFHPSAATNVCVVLPKPQTLSSDATLF